MKYNPTYTNEARRWTEHGGILLKPEIMYGHQFDFVKHKEFHRPSGTNYYYIRVFVNGEEPNFVANYSFKSKEEVMEVIRKIGKKSLITREEEFLRTHKDYAAKLEKTKKERTEFEKARPNYIEPWWVYGFNDVLPTGFEQDEGVYVGKGLEIHFEEHNIRTPKHEVIDKVVLDTYFDSSTKSIHIKGSKKSFVLTEKTTKAQWKKTMDDYVVQVKKLAKQQY